MEAVRWLLDEPGAFWMLLLAAMASTTNVVLGTLGPQYVREVLAVDPTFTFYVFAPASLGVVGGLSWRRWRSASSASASPRRSDSPRSRSR
jgi:hypothetical protein